MDLIQWINLAFLPLAGILGGLIADRRSKKNTTAVVEVSKLEAATSARNAASTEFNMITQGFTSSFVKMQQEIEALSRQNNELLASNQHLAGRLDEVLEYLDKVEVLVPVDLRPPRPDAHWRDS